MIVPAESPGAGLTLVLEASTASASVALLDGDTLRHRADVPMGVSREDALFPAIQAMLAAEGCTVRDLRAIVCGSGPGSFTSLRIAASLAKGLADAAAVPLYAVPSLLLAAASWGAPGQYLVHSDALRGERYALRVSVDAAGMARAEGEVERLHVDALATAADGRVRLAVPGGAAVVPDQPVVPDAGRLMHVPEWRERGRVDLASWEPAYGRLAEAQVKWEAAHDRPLPTS